MKETLVELTWNRTYNIISKGNDEDFEKLLGKNPQSIIRFFEILSSKLVKTKDGIIKLRNLSEKEISEASSIINPSLLDGLSLERIQRIVREVPNLPTRLKAQSNNLLLASLFIDPVVRTERVLYTKSSEWEELEIIRFQLQESSNNFLKAIALGADFSDVAFNGDPWFNFIGSQALYDEGYVGYEGASIELFGIDLARDKRLSRLNKLLKTIIEHTVYVAPNNLSSINEMKNIIKNIDSLNATVLINIESSPETLLYSKEICQSLETLENPQYNSPRFHWEVSYLLDRLFLSSSLLIGQNEPNIKNLENVEEKIKALENKLPIWDILFKEDRDVQPFLNSLRNVVNQGNNNLIVSNVSAETEIPQGPANIPTNTRNSNSGIKRQKLFQP